MTLSLRRLSLAASAVFFAPSLALACACGCGIFDVGTSSNLPNQPGGSVWVEYNYANQDKNWHGTSSAPSDDNENKKIRTNYYNVGGQYMFNRDWGVKAVVPVLDRAFITEDGTAQHTKLGDVRVSGIYSGFSPDMSTGVTFGLKLPTGDYTDAVYDRDTAIGSGSTDLLLGGYHRGWFNDRKLYGWFANSVLDQPVLTQDHYRPGAEISAAVGVYREGWNVGDKATLAPVLQLVGSHRFRDSGAESESDNTGYTQLIVSPGVELAFDKTTLYGDVGLPVYRDVRGQQLVAPVLVKVGLRYSF